MPGTMRKLAEYLGLTEPQDDDVDEEFLDDDPGPSTVRPLGPGSRSVSSFDPRDPERRPLGERHVRPVDVEPAPYKIKTFMPTNYNDARDIGAMFRDDVPVIMNLTDMDDGNAKRLVDFAAGLTFGLGGHLEKVTNKVFLLSPANVTVSAEDKERISEGRFFNQS